MSAASPWPLDPGQDVTHRCKSLSPKTGIKQRLAPIAQILPCVGVHIRVRVLQAVKVSLTIVAALLFQNTDVLMGFALLWAVSAYTKLILYFSPKFLMTSSTYWTR
jgi:hypothetical protein